MSLETFVRHALELAIIIPTAYMAYLPMRRWLRTSRTTTLYVLALCCAAIIVVGSTICMELDWPSIAATLLFTPSFFVLYCSLVRLKVQKSLFCLLNASMLGVFSNLYTSIITAPLEVDNDFITFLPVSSLFCLGLMSVLLLVFYRTFSYKFPMLFAQESLDRVWAFAWLLPLALTGVLVWTNPLNEAMMVEGHARNVGMVLFLLIPLVVFYFYDIVWRFASSLIASARLRQENDLLSIEEKRYQEMHEYMASTRALRHDFRHHLLAIQELARTGEREELVDYVDQLGDMADRGYKRLCANRVIDAVAARYEAEAVDQQTTITWQLNLPEELPFKDTDLCAIVGNLVENAIHAVAELPEEERHIEVSARLLTDVMLGITVQNPYKGRVILNRRGLPYASSKGIGHGVGLESVASIVRGYNGTMDISTKDGIFKVGILLYA